MILDRFESDRAPLGLCVPLERKVPTTAAE